MNIRRRNFLTIGAVLSGLLITGCATTAKLMEPDPAKVVIRIASSTDLNPDMMGRASPIVVRVYELKSDDIFNNADFFALYDEDASILGDDMTARDEMNIPPDEHVSIEKELDIEARYIGVIAAYRDLDNAVWRGSIETPLDETTYIDVTLGKLSLSVKKGEKKGGFFGF
ncbi:MAG: type VI secretion system lipoprotein TssJ [Pseudomonadota bacterium]